MKTFRTLVISLATTCILFAGCSKEKEQDNNSQVATVKVHVSDFTVSQEDFPASGSKADPADYNGVNAMTLAFYNAAGTEVVKTTQLKNENTTYTTFGEFECSLPMGSYTMVVVAYKTQDDSPFVLTGPTAAAFTGAHAFETFATTQVVNITNTSAVDISATLNRIVAKLQVISTDGKTANATNVRMTFAAGGKSFNPTSGLATSNTGFANTVPISAAVGSPSNSTSYIFLASDEQDVDVTIETLDADGNTLFSKTIENVPFKRNRVTKLTGAMYTNTGVDGTFQITTDWETEYNGQF